MDQVKDCERTDFNEWEQNPTARSPLLRMQNSTPSLVSLNLSRTSVKLVQLVGSATEQLHYFLLEKPCNASLFAHEP